ncbi:MAG: GDP-mannose 4,6-dehydratase [Candidatus Omnitrophica bacterium]|nr:GDP-mannose 4,6-dehydratase [Candidatus Omnitrophota bacterium]MDD5430368.1 GDP-mannose 4,6-dehydratase [Candidatus Omnitrophota bacterium]
MNKSEEANKSFKGKKVLITGGLGFIGSNLAVRLVELGAQVTLLDAMIKGHGGNIFNIEPVKNKVEVKFNDLRDEKEMDEVVKGKDYIFHLAGQNDHTLSLKNPFPDIEINIKGSAVLLEACRKSNPEARIVYTGTRGEYGPAIKLPVSEDAPINPKGIYELSSLTVQKLFKIYNDNHKIKSVTLRLTNVYGERSQMKHDRFGVVNWFIRLAIDNSIIKVFGDGSILRDFLYIEDAVNAIIMCALCQDAQGEVFNVGHNKAYSFLELVKSIINISGSGSWEFCPFTPERLAQEPGDFYSDINKIKRIIGWSPEVDLKEGLKKTITYYEKYKKMYW